MKKQWFYFKAILILLFSLLVNFFYWISGNKKRYHYYRTDPSGVDGAQPIMFQVENLSDKTINDIDVLGAYEYLVQPPEPWEWDRLGQRLTKDADIVISSIVGTISYKEILANFFTYPFDLGMMYIHGNMGSEFNAELSLTSTHATGRKASVPIGGKEPDKLYGQKHIGIYHFKAEINGGTKITIKCLLPKSKLVFYLYPVFKKRSGISDFRRIINEIVLNDICKKDFTITQI